MAARSGPQIDGLSALGIMGNFEAHLNSRARSRLRRRLLDWYDLHKRDLPWRRRQGDAYAQMLAELMLQQTQVSTVTEHYQRFIRRFPAIVDLAQADLSEVLTLWSGLGYYSRARQLHAAAKTVVDRYGGVVPSDVDRLMTLPGIGRYTAGAIASIAYGRRAAVLDGNVTRVLMRLLALDANPKSSAVRTYLWSVAERLLPRRRCGDFNQALMELGASVCRPKSPICSDCPIKPYCRAAALGLTDLVPKPAKRARLRPVDMVVAAVRRDDRLLFARRPLGGLWPGLWELPSEPLASGEPDSAGLQRLRRRLGRGYRISSEPVATTTRTLTHRVISFRVFAGRACQDSVDPSSGCGSGSSGACQPLRWLAADELAGIGISRASLAILTVLGGTS